MRHSPDRWQDEKPAADTFMAELAANPVREVEGVNETVIREAPLGLTEFHEWPVDLWVWTHQDVGLCWIERPLTILLGVSGTATGISKAASRHPLFSGHRIPGKPEKRDSFPNLGTEYQGMILFGDNGQEIARRYCR